MNSECSYYNQLKKRIYDYDEILQKHLDITSAPLGISWGGYIKEGPRHSNEDRMLSTIHNTWLYMESSHKSNRSRFVTAPLMLSSSKEAVKNSILNANDHRISNKLYYDNENINRTMEQDILLEWHNKLWSRYNIERSPYIGFNTLSMIYPDFKVYMSRFNNNEKRLCKVQTDDERQIIEEKYKFGQSNLHLAETNGITKNFPKHFVKKLCVNHRLVQYMIHKSDNETVIVPSENEVWWAKVLKHGLYCIDVYRQSGEIDEEEDNGTLSWKIDKRRGSIVNNIISKNEYNLIFDSNSVQFTLCDGHDRSYGSRSVSQSISRSLQHAWHRGLPTLEQAMNSNGNYTNQSTPMTYTINNQSELVESASVFVQGPNRGRKPAEIVDRIFKETMAGCETVFQAEAERYMATRNQELTSGSCVLTSLLVYDQIFTAQLGDSAALVLTITNVSNLSEKNNYKYHEARLPGEVEEWDRCGLQAVWLSKPMRCDEEPEKSRIENLGVAISNDGRIAGLLEPSRTIGDLDVKQMTPDGTVSIVPEVTKYRITRPSLLFFGTDGVFDFCGVEDILSLFQARSEYWNKLCKWLTYRSASEWLTKSTDDIQPLTVEQPSINELQEVGKMITEMAIKCGSRDDCSVLVLFACPVIGTLLKNDDENLFD